MKCNYCGSEIKEGINFCTNCGSKLKEEANISSNDIMVANKKEEENPKKKKSKCWRVFAILSLILGLISFIPILGFETAPFGFVFGILGMRAEDKSDKSKGRAGLICSILGFCESILIYIIYLLVVVLIYGALTTGWYFISYETLVELIQEIFN